MSNSSRYQVDLMRRWIGFYRNVYGIALHDVFVPEPEPSFDGKWLVVRDPRLDAQRIVEQIRRSYDAFVWTGRDLGKVLDRSNSVRSAAEGPYGIWVNASEEPDEDLMGKSGAELKHQGLTLEERLLLDKFYWSSTGRHLDSIFRTLCTGSTYDNGGMPTVGWDVRNKQLIVDCCFLPNSAHADLVARKVIASPEIPQLGLTYQ